MTAHEQQDQGVVLVGPVLDGRDQCIDLLRRFGLASAPRRLAPDVIGHAPRGDLNQPAARILRRAVARPLRRSRDECLLHRVLGGGEIAVATDGGAKHLRRELAQQLLCRRIEGRAGHE